MADSTIKYGDLSADAKTVAVAQFGRFYVQRYRTTGLDLLAQMDRSGRIADINQFLMENATLHSDELVTGVLAHRNENLADLIASLGLTYDVNGHANPALAAWYDSLIAEMSTN